MQLSPRSSHIVHQSGMLQLEYHISITIGLHFDGARNHKRSKAILLMRTLNQRHFTSKQSTEPMGVVQTRGLGCHCVQQSALLYYYGLVGSFYKARNMFGFFNCQPKVTVYIQLQKDCETLYL